MRTIWSPAVQRGIEPQWRFLVLYVLPLIYGVNTLSFLFFGTINGGSKVMRAALGPWGSLALNTTIGLSSLVALIGLATVHHQMERWGSIVMVSGCIGYLILLFFALGSGSAPTSVLSGTTITTVLVAVRVQRVARDIGRKRAKR